MRGQEEKVLIRTNENYKTDENSELTVRNKNEPTFKLYV